MTKNVKKLFRKITVLILNGLGISTLSSCWNNSTIYETAPEYGMPPNYHSVQGTVRGPDTDGDGIGEPISGIQYSYNGMTFETLPVTDENGYYYVDLWDEEESVIISFKDIDGEANGSFEDKEVTVTFNKQNINQDINLTSK